MADPNPAAERVVLKLTGYNEWCWPSGAVAVRLAILRNPQWIACGDNTDGAIRDYNGVLRYFSSPSEAAASIGAVLP
jgi:hypothetical protein